MSLTSSDFSLKKRLLLTFIVLLVYRLGTFIPLPGINPELLKVLFSSTSANLFGMVNLFSGGGLERMSIFALNIMPYITSSIIMQLLTSVFRSLDFLKRDGANGRAKINQYTKYLTVSLALIQSIGVYYALSSSESLILISDSSIFLWTTCITLVGGTVVIMWFGEKITGFGVGNGISLIIFIGIASSLPNTIIQVLDLSRNGVYNWFELSLFLLSSISFLLIICFVEKSFRKVKIQYPNQISARSSSSNPHSFIPLKLNISGVIPPIFASSILVLPSALYHLAGKDPEISSFSTLSRGGLTYSLAFSVLIVFFSYFYSSVILNTREVSDNLKKTNCFILGIRPGKLTSEYLDKIIFKITALGSAYLIFICILPEILIANYSLPLRIGGTGALILVNVVLDSFSQIQSHIFSKKYGSIARKKRLRVRS